MGLFDTLKSLAEQELQSQGPALLNQALANTPLGGATGLIDQLVQGGLGPAVQAIASGTGGSVSPEQVGAALDPAHLQQLAQQFGVNPTDVLSMISQHLPAMVKSQG
jgi:uncharacterized protein YidB (DUF937 family)